MECEWFVSDIWLLVAKACHPLKHHTQTTHGAAQWEKFVKDIMHYHLCEKMLWCTYIVEAVCSQQHFVSSIYYHHYGATRNEPTYSLHFVFSSFRGACQIIRHQRKEKDSPFWHQQLFAFLSSNIFLFNVVLLWCKRHSSERTTTKQTKIELLHSTISPLDDDSWDNCESGS